MKRNYMTLAIFLCFASLLVGVVIKYFPFNSKKGVLDDNIFIHTNFEEKSDAYKKIKYLAKAFNKIGAKAKILSFEEKESSEYNIYIVNDITNLPKVKNLDAINVLWCPYIAFNDDIENFRDFDVIVVKSMPSFSHLKAINARVAFIPDAIDMKKVDKKTNNRILYYGNNNNAFSLVMYLTKDYDIDIIGKGWSYSDVRKKVIKTEPKNDDFSKYDFVLIDQTEEEIMNNIVNSDLIKVLENGGVPVVRFNPGISDLFDDRVIMYYNEEDFHKTINDIVKNKNIVRDMKSALYARLDDWNSLSVANKFTEIFQIMKKKRIN